MKKIFSIDFKSISSASLQKIDARFIQTGERKKWMFFNKSIKANFYKLAVQNVKLSKTIELHDVKKFIVIERDELAGKKSKTIIANEHRDFLIEQFDYPYKILLDPKQISDYYDLTTDEQTITFQLFAQTLKDSEPTVIDYNIQLIFNPARMKAIGQFELEDDFINGFEYKNLSKVKLGVLYLKNQADFYYADMLNCRVSVLFDDQTSVQDIITLGEVSEIEETNPFQLVDIGLVEEGDMDSDVDKYYEEGELILKGIMKNNVIGVPLFIDLTRLENPYTKSELHHLTILFKGDSNLNSIKQSFKILQDRVTTDLVATIKLGTDEMTNLVSGESLTHNNSFLWSNQSEDSSLTIFEIKLGNVASTGRGEVVVKNLFFTISRDKDSESILVTRKGKKLQDLFLVNDKPISALATTYRFKNGTNAKKRFRLTVKEEDIIDIPDDLTILNCQIYFDYALSSDDFYEHTFENTIQFKIERSYGADWLAIDFGTSATVMAFGSGSSTEDKIILHDQLTKLYNLDRLTKGREKEVEEKGYFLDSTILLREGGAINGTNYHNDVIFLSPYKGLILEKSERILPYLKSLIGTKKIPKYNQLAFYYKNKPTDIEDIEITVDTDKEKLIETEQVLSNTYKILIRDFALPRIFDSGKVQNFNKIIFTVPNSFTPVHNRLIEELVLKEIAYKKLKAKHIAFTSESDAVAAYYINSNNWRKFNKGRIRPKTEYVLIYDMGAGTLDVTYLKIELSATGNFSTEILGRIGKKTAGNYFDYVLAEVIVNKFEEFRQKNLMRFKPEYKVQYVEFKRIIKQNIKPNLDNDEEWTLYSDSISDILEKDIYINNIELNDTQPVKDFIKGNSKTLFDNFFALISEKQKGGQQQFKIDTVLFSGRSTQYEKLRTAVKTTLRQWAEKEDKIHFIENLKPTELKSAVVDGATYFASTFINLQSQEDNSGFQILNKNIQARYGFLYKSPPHKKAPWTFKELLNPTVKATDEMVRNHIDGVDIFCYDTEEYDINGSNNGRGNYIDIRYTDKIYCVQSYAKDTAKDMEEGSMEYISKMYEFKRTDIGASNNQEVPVRIEINEQNEIQFFIGTKSSAKMSPLSFDVRDMDNTFKKSMWPYLLG